MYNSAEPATSALNFPSCVDDFYNPLPEDYRTNSRKNNPAILFPAVSVLHGGLPFHSGQQMTRIGQ